MHKISPISKRFNGRVSYLTTYVLITASLIAGSLNFFQSSSERVVASPSPTVRPEFWITDGDVNDIAVGADGTVYLAGEFTRMGEFTGSAVPVDATTGIVESTFPKVEKGQVNTMVPDGSGGWFFGGNFSRIDGITRNGLAHILPDRSVDPAWTTSATGGFSGVQIMKLVGTTLYIGGTFDTVGGQARDYLAALNASDGSVLPWAPVVDKGPSPYASANVGTMYVNGTTLYVGGAFYSIDGNIRHSIASFDTATGNLNTFSVDLVSKYTPQNAGVYDMAIVGSQLYIGGSFEKIGAIIRPNLISVDPTTGALNSLNLNISDISAVTNLEAYGTKIYIGGYFSNIGGQSRMYLAALDTTSSTITSFNPNLGMFDASYIGTIAINGTKMYITGDFSNISGQDRYFVGVYDLTSETLTSWNPGFSTLPSNFAFSGSTVYAGGYLSFVGGVLRNNLAAINPSTGQPTSWAPSAGSTDQYGTGEVMTIAINGSSAYIGGYFDLVNSTSRLYGAQISLSDGSLGSWNPNFQEFAWSSGEHVNTIEINNSTIYAGGEFTTASSQVRHSAAAFDLSTGNLTSWDPNLDDWAEVNAFEFTGSTIYIGGNFANAGVTPRMNAAEVDSATGAVVTAWAPEPDINVRAIRRYGSSVYVGGCFFNAGGQERNSIIETNPSDGSATAWNPQLDSCSAGEGTYNGVTDIIRNGSSVFIAGDFSMVGADTRWAVAEIDAATALATSWDVNTDRGVNKIILTADRFYMGGDFPTAGGFDMSSFAAFDNNDPIVTPSPSPSPSPEPQPNVQFSSSASSGLESVTSVNLPLTLSGTYSSDVTVNYAVTGGTATGSGTDFTLANGTATISAGQLTTNIPLTVINDSISELDETVLVTISNPTNATLGSTVTFTYTINNNDATGVTISESGLSTNVTEGGSIDTYTIVLTSQPTADVTVNITPSSQLTTNVSSRVFTSVNWSVPQSVTVTAFDDSIIEGNHTGTIGHAGTSTDPNYNGDSYTTVTANIVDNDSAGASVVESGGSTTVSEAGQSDTFTIVLTSQPATNVVVNVNSAGGLTTMSAPRLTTNVTTLTFTPSDWNTPQIVTINAVDDAIYQGTQSSNITFAVSSSDGNYNGLSVTPVTATILDNEPAPTPTPSPSPTVTASPSPVVTQKPVVVTASPTITVLPSISPTPSDTPTPTPEQSPTPTVTPTVSVSPTKSVVATVNPTTTPPPLELRVKVLDVESKPIPGAIVRVPTINQEKKTGRDGVAIFKNVKEGNYDVFVKFKEEQHEQKVVVAAVPDALSGASTSATKTNSVVRPVFDFTIKLDSKFEQTVMEKLLADSGTLGIASVGVVTVVSLFQLVPFIRPFIAGGFLLPLLGALFGGKKRKSNSGQVIDDLEREGIAFAMIRVIDPITQKVIKKVVAGLTGHFVIKLPAGQYVIEITKSRYLTKQVVVTLTQEINFIESMFEIGKDPQLDVATQIPLKIAGFDPKALSSIFAILISLINAVYMRTVIAFVIFGVVTLAGFAFIKLSSKMSQLNFIKKD